MHDLLRPLLEVAGDREDSRLSLVYTSTLTDHAPLLQSFGSACEHTETKHKFASSLRSCSKLGSVHIESGGEGTGVSKSMQEGVEKACKKRVQGVYRMVYDGVRKDV